MTRKRRDSSTPGRKPRAKVASDQRLHVPLSPDEHARVLRVAGDRPMSTWARDPILDAARRGKRGRGKQHAALVAMIDSITDRHALDALEVVIAVYVPSDDDDDDEGDDE